MILLDWTRMGAAYCLAGAVREGGRWRVVRPLMTKLRAAADGKVGWSALLLDGHCRWEVFELVGAEPAWPEPPHTEDLWVRTMRPRQRLASADERRAMLTETRAAEGQPLFGASLTI